jgi:serine/threonine-protein kinase
MKRFLRGIAIFLALIGVGIISAFAVVALLLRQEEVRVPDLTGQDIITVIDTLPQLGLQPKIERRETHPTLPRDTVISQTPPPGGTLKKGRQLRLVLSLGQSEVQIPKLVGEHFRKADILIRQAGFFPGNLSRVSSDTVERDIVIAQEPQPGAFLDKGGKINVLISSGKRSGRLIMPNLIGKKADQAVRMVDRIGLQYRISYKAAAGTGSAGERAVISQKPGPGSPVTAEGTVDIVVAK